MDDLKIRLVHPSYNLKELLFFNYSIQKYVDTLIIGSNGSIKAHSTILVEKSDVFKSLLSEQEHKEEKVVNLAQFSVEVLKVIIEFMYRGDSRYFKEIEKEVKRAITYFFETPNILSDSDCVEIKPNISVVILSDSDNEELCDSSQSHPRNVKNETNIQQTTRTKSPTHKRRIFGDAEIDSTQNGYVSKKKKKSLPFQNNNNESIVNLSPLKHLSQISVSRKKTLEKAKVIKKDMFKRKSEEESTVSNKRRVNPFASSTTLNNGELQGPSIQEDALNTKSKRVNILDHTIMESPIIEVPARQSPEIIIEDPINIIDSFIIPTTALLQEPLLSNTENPCTDISQDEFNTNISEEFTSMEEIANCRNISQESVDIGECCTSVSQEPTQMDCPSSPELEVGQDHCTSTSEVLSEEHTSIKKATTLEYHRKMTPEPTNKEPSNKSERPIIRNRIAFDSTDDEEFPQPISSSKRTKKLTTLKKPILDKIKSKKSEHSVLDILNMTKKSQNHICVVCMKEVNNFPKHFDRKHHSLSKTLFECSECKHKFFFKFLHDEHQANCTKKSCICIDCKPH